MRCSSSNNRGVNKKSSRKDNTDNTRNAAHEKNSTVACYNSKTTTATANYDVSRETDGMFATYP